MRKRLVSLLLLLSLALALLPMAVSARGGMDNFTAARRYDGRFEDVPTGSWFYSNVTALYELGLTDGQSGSRFGAESSVTLAEALSFAARIHSTYYLGDAAAGPAQYKSHKQNWYAPYVQYLKGKGVVDGRFDAMLTGPATRGQVAYILSRVLPAQEFDRRNADLVLTAHNSGRYIADVTGATPYAEEILNLYRWGIVTGSDSKGSFRPASTITRSELAAMLTRMVDPSLRLTPKWDMSALYSAKGATYGGFVSGEAAFTASHARDDLKAISGNVRYAFRNNLTSIQVYLTGCSATDTNVDAMMEHYLAASMLYPEQCYSNVFYSYNSTGRVTITFRNPNGGDRGAALQKAVALHDQFWSDGTLRLGMNQKEIARVYFDYLCAHCDYDYGYNDISYTAYGALYNGLAVCQGYTGAYNIFLNLEGIACSAYSGDNHIWTTATLDGVPYHLDVTWGDQKWGVDETYFCMTPAESLRLHS